MMVLLYFRTADRFRIFRERFFFSGPGAISKKLLKCASRNRFRFRPIAISNLRYRIDASCHISALPCRFSRHLK